jgi:hypothetical protein
MKIMKKALMGLVLTAGCLGLGSCGENAVIEHVYEISEYSAIAQMGWSIVTNHELTTFGDKKSYRLTTTTEMYGPISTGFETKGYRTVVATGYYTSVVSADGVAAHLDVTLDAASRVYVAQYGKAWGRNTDILGSTTMLDTANWTDAMTEIYEGGAEGLKAAYGKKQTCTIEVPSLDKEDTTLAYRMVTVPVDA